MNRCPISFNDGAMDHISDDELPEVRVASRAVVQGAKDAGVWILGGRIERQQPPIMRIDGTVASDNPRDRSRRRPLGLSFMKRTVWFIS